MTAKGLGLFLLGAIAAVQLPAYAAPAAGNLPAPQFLVRADWQEPTALPGRFRNHCQIDRISGRPFCASHCGLDYQFFYCSRASSGCCHIGRGYCGWDGLLRCSP